MVHDLSDIHESTISLNDEHYPKLLNRGLSGLELDDLVWDIGEDLRHIMYHIATNEYHRCLLDFKLRGSNVSEVLLDKWPQLQNDKEKMDALSRELAGVVELTSRYREDLYPRLLDLDQGVERRMAEIEENLGQVAQRIANGKHFDFVFLTQEDADSR